MTFEEKLKRLEEIGDLLSEGKLPLKESITLFEEGMLIAKNLEKDLSKIERKVEKLVSPPQESDNLKAPEKTPEFELFPELD